MENITEYNFQKYCKGIALEAIEESKNHGGEVETFIQESASGSEYGIYYQKAIQVLANCSTELGEYALEDSCVSLSLRDTIAQVVCFEIEARALAHAQELGAL